MLEVNGARLYYETRGEGHPLLLSHAGIADRRMWDDQIEVFAQRYRVVRYDHRGFGRSELPPAPYAFHEDLYGVLRALGIERAYLIGVSIGGAAVIDFTLAHPEMVDALITVGAGVSGLEVPNTAEEMALFERVEQAIEAGDLDGANAQEVHIWVDGPRRSPEQVDPRVRERVSEMNRPTFDRTPEQQEKAKHQSLDPPAAGRLSEIHVPTLVIVGDQDVSDVQLTADRLAAEIPGARKVVMQGTAHVPNMEQPEEFNRIVLDFLGGLR
jgi:pimeloyl-ACP methyl ester carboxylesterase